MTAFVNDPVNNGTPSSLTRGKVITTTGKEILGDIYIPVEFKIALDVGSLYLAAGKLRAITFTEAKDEAGRKDEAARPAAAAPDAPAQTGQPGAAVAEESPIFFRQGNRLVVFMPGGNRVAFYDIESKTSKTIELLTSKDSRVEVSPVVGPDILALSLHGPKITRIAVADLARHLASAGPAPARRGACLADRRPRACHLQPGPVRLRLQRPGPALGRRRDPRGPAHHAHGRVGRRHDPGPRSHLSILPQDREMGAHRRPGHPGYCGG